MWQAVQLEMQYNTYYSNTLLCLTEKLKRENFALRAEAVRLQSKLYQCQGDKALSFGIATELAADLREVRAELDKTDCKLLSQYRAEDSRDEQRLGRPVSLQQRLLDISLRTMDLRNLLSNDTGLAGVVRKRELSSQCSTQTAVPQAQCCDPCLELFLKP